MLLFYGGCRCVAVTRVSWAALGASLGKGRNGLRDEGRDRRVVSGSSGSHSRVPPTCAAA